MGSTSRWQTGFVQPAVNLHWLVEVHGANDRSTVLCASNDGRRHGRRRVLKIAPPGAAGHPGACPYTNPLDTSNAIPVIAQIRLT